MSPRGQKRPTSETARMVRTTLELPEDLWRAIKLKAVEDRSDLRAITIAALEAYLGFTRKPASRTRGQGKDHKKAKG